MTVSEIALDYHTNGFFPLALKGKTLIRRGVSGNATKNLSRDSISKIGNDNNLGLRLPKTVVGLDWDAYRGAQGFLALIELLGDLPATYRSTSRTDGLSGIYLYTVPFGTKFVGEIKDCHVDLIQHTHRYATVFPSIHPETGRQYSWYFGAPGKDSFEIDIPKVDKLPELPKRWLQWLAQMANIRSNPESVRFGSKLASFSTRVAEFAQMGAGDRNNVMKDLARDGMWYELGGRLQEDQSFQMILEAAHTNGLVEDEGEATILYRINFSRTWAAQRFDPKKAGSVTGSFDKEALLSWNSSIQVSSLSTELKFAANLLVSFALQSERSSVPMSSRALAFTAGVSQTSASRYLNKLEAKGWIKITRGDQMTLTSNVVTFLFENLIEGAPEAPLVDGVVEIINEYAATAHDSTFRIAVTNQTAEPEEEFEADSTEAPAQVADMRSEKRIDLLPSGAATIIPVSDDEILEIQRQLIELTELHNQASVARHRERV